MIRVVRFISGRHQRNELNGFQQLGIDSLLFRDIVRLRASKCLRASATSGLLAKLDKNLTPTATVIRKLIRRPIEQESNAFAVEFGKPSLYFDYLNPRWL